MVEPGRSGVFATSVPVHYRPTKITFVVNVGKHDFKSFAANRNYEMETTVRTLTRCDFKQKGPLLTFTIEGDGFLYKMCRGIVGTIVQVGLGKFTASEIKTMLAQKDRRVAGMTAPAQGLVLWKVFYE